MFKMLQLDAPSGSTVYVAPGAIAAIVPTNTPGFVELKLVGGNNVIVKADAQAIARQVTATVSSVTNL